MMAMIILMMIMIIMKIIIIIIIMLMISNVISMGRSRRYMLQVWARESVHRKDKINHRIPINGMFTLCEKKKT